MLTGALQVAFGWAGLARSLKFVPRSVMVGFVNALAILILLAQLPQFAGENWQMYAMVGAGVAIIALLPRVFRAVPSALVAIVVLTVVSVRPARTCARWGRWGRCRRRCRPWPSRRFR
ncbi:SulP family inorganic anion transporter [Deinococcus sedimenti]|uniref:SLC26A/SulP transporter domain-containing protein n=1 Tax=Deinococcus sedimenti TaxID=1867090 RepID=A0ABQ2S743_9DEIO|nr:SulP family inorganic anion transporter [Deinococcus sedimenti]GGS04042.1 hypothetical protein GCM10008960_33370 [Deinococcus sedimenti]